MKPFIGDFCHVERCKLGTTDGFAVVIHDYGHPTIEAFFPVNDKNSFNEGKKAMQLANDYAIKQENRIQELSTYFKSYGTSEAKDA